MVNETSYMHKWIEIHEIGICLYNENNILAYDGKFATCILRFTYKNMF